MTAPFLLNDPAAQRSRIHNKLVEIVQAGPYYRTFNDSATKAAIGGGPVTPASCVANETGASFLADNRHGRKRILRRDTWTWLVIVKFDVEVTSHLAEDGWLQDPPILPADSTSGSQQATIELERASYQHPTKHQGHGGSVIEFEFNVSLSRR